MYSVIYHASLQRAPAGSSFNQNINNWNVSNVIDMRKMFCNAVSFNQNINNWNVSSVKYMCYMFYNTKIPFYKLNTTSFFDEPYKKMTPLNRKKIFDTLFHWERRKNYIMFLKYFDYIV